MAKFPSKAALSASGGRKLAVIGGRLEDDNADIYGEMHRLSGGRILVFPTASAEPEAVGEESLDAFRSHGFEAAVAPLYGPQAALRAGDPDLLALIAEYGHFYFTGGDQANILAALAPGGVLTASHRAITACLAKGGLLAGSSAGAAMMSQPMLLGGTSLESVVHGVTERPEAPGLLIGDGLGFFPFGMVDQHFIKRGRLGRMVVAMHATGQTTGFGIDENTALIVEGGAGKVVGEYGVMLVDTTGMETDANLRSYQDFRLSYLDHGDWIDLRTGRPHPADAKRKVLKRDIAYRGRPRSRRNAFGAYTLYDLMARLVLGDPKVYRQDSVEAYDAKSAFNVSVTLERVERETRCMISTPETGLRMTALNFRTTILAEKLSATRLADRMGRRQTRTFGMDPRPEAKIVLLGSSPLRSAAEMTEAPFALLKGGKVGVLASASAEPRATARDHIEMLARHGIEGIDLEVTIDTVEYAAHDAGFLQDVEAMSGFLFCGGNQIRLVETLLHRGEESALLRAIAHAHAKGAPLIAASGAAAALSGVMIAGGSTYEALRFGVSSDVGHQGLAIQEGIGLFAAGIVDQNLISQERLGRLVVACAEENERFGIGIFEDSAVIASEAGMKLEATGLDGFVLVEIDPAQLVLQSDNFVANGVRLTVFGPGDSVDLRDGTVSRAGDVAASAALLERLVVGLSEEAGAAVAGENAGIHGVMAREGGQDGATAWLDLACPRDDF
ncbi:cyanophycinase [Mangrovicoccus sp. HB161399]|uniref:cyanophycinase n=1 Tax=Mangrovicoccus sp. HB161399 TaxID=2720392 RepID=UPI0015575D9B|nr:cyanophycinase [Mangrovicoccus sp. HB161399]